MMIINKKRTPSAKEIYNKPEWFASKIKWLWSDDYYDGPLSGMIEYDNAPYYAMCFDEQYKIINYDNKNDNDEEDVICHRTFAIYKLTSERQKYEEAWHEFFRLAVYNNTDNPISFKDPRSQFYYAKRKQIYDLLDLKTDERHGKLVGWFKD